MAQKKNFKEIVAAKYEISSSTNWAVELQKHDSMAYITDSAVSFPPGKFINGEFIKTNGMSWFLTGIFLVGDLAGGGVVALPTAMIQLGFYPGLVINFIMNVIMILTALYLSSCWNILLACWPEYRHHCRKPYPEIAFRAFGQPGRTFVTICVDITQFGLSVVYLLLSAKNIHDLIKSFFSIEVSFCYVIVILGVCILPLLFLKSPQDFWWAVVVAMVVTSIAVAFIVLGSALDYDSCHAHKQMPEFRITNYFLGTGTLLFAYGGHSTFPTIQHDMKRTKEFNKAIIFAFGVLFVMYTPVAVFGFLTYGDSLRSSVINSIQTQWIQQIVNIMITLHCTLAITLVSNPLSQDIEGWFNIPHEFGIKRVLLRTSIMVAVIFISLSVPNFGPLMDLMGGTTLGLTAVVLPPLFYVSLKATQKMMRTSGLKNQRCTWNQAMKLTDRKVLALTGIIVVLGVFSGAAATYSAIRELSSTQFTYPCYVLPFVKNAESPDSGSSATYCCGRFQNITAQSNIVCATPSLNFYG